MYKCVFSREREQEKKALHSYIYTQIMKDFTRLIVHNRRFVLWWFRHVVEHFFPVFIFASSSSLLFVPPNPTKCHTVLIKRHHSFAWFPSMFKLNDFRPSFSRCLSAVCFFFRFVCMPYFILYMMWCDSW